MNIYFLFNRASSIGSDIFGGLIDRCQLNTFSEIIRNFVPNQGFSGFDYLKTIAQFQIGIDYSDIINPFNIYHIAKTITRKHVKGLISSNPVQLCFCDVDNEDYDCTDQWPRIFIKRGESFSVGAITVDQVENPVNGTVVASILTKSTSLNVDQTQQVTNGVCTMLIYNIFSTLPNASFELFPAGPCDNIGISRKMLNVTFLPCECPSGLQPAPIDNECRCICDYTVQAYVTSCQLHSDSITVVRVTESFWIDYGTADNNMTAFLTQMCPYDYCIKRPVNLSINLPLNVDKQCAYNRTGIMCGKCEEGLSLVFGSSRCVQCSNNYLALLIAFAFAGVALVVFILILNTTVAVGTIHGLILYANLVGANSSVFLPAGTVLRFFVFWVNLDLGIETCFL